MNNREKADVFVIRGPDGRYMGHSSGSVYWTNLAKAEMFARFETAKNAAEGLSRKGVNATIHECHIICDADEF